MGHRLTRIDQSRIDMSATNGFGTNRSRVDDSRHIPDFLETVGPPIDVCGQDLP